MRQRHRRWTAPTAVGRLVVASGGRIVSRETLRLPDSPLASETRRPPFNEPSRTGDGLGRSRRPRSRRGRRIGNDAGCVFGRPSAPTGRRMPTRRTPKAGKGMKSFGRACGTWRRRSRRAWGRPIHGQPGPRQPNQPGADDVSRETPKRTHLDCVPHAKRTIQAEPGQPAEPRNPPKGPVRGAIPSPLRPEPGHPNPFRPVLTRPPHPKRGTALLDPWSTASRARRRSLDTRRIAVNPPWEEPALPNRSPATTTPVVATPLARITWTTTPTRTTPHTGPEADQRSGALSSA